MTPKNIKKTDHQPRASELVRHPVFLCLLLVGVTILAFWPVVNADFINYDDPDYVTENPMVQQGLTGAGVKWAFTTAHASNWHPLTWLSHLLDVQIFGLGATGPHCVNLGLHSLNAVLLYWLLRKMTGTNWRSFLVAGLFALHPVHVESVAWVAERKDVLSTLFWLLTLLAYAGYTGALKIPGSRRKAFYVLALILFALGLMSKPMLVTLPFVMLLLDFWPLQRIEPTNSIHQPRPVPRLVLEKIPFLLLSIASCFVTTWAQKQALQPLTHLAVSDRIGNTLISYCRYLGKAVWPVDLALPYLHPGHWPAMQVALAAVLIAGLTCGAVFTSRKYPFILTGWLWYLGTLIPVIGLVQVGIQAIADRYTYVPMIGIFIALVWSAGAISTQLRLPRIAIGFAAAGLICCVILTRQQVKLWQDSETLFNHSARVTENNYVALSNVGGALFKRGELDKAMTYYQRAIQINPNHIDAINSIGAILAAQGRDEAINWFSRTLALQPAHADALFNMGNALARQGKGTEASRYFQEALQIRPDNYEARNNLANNLIKLGKIDEAISQYRQALDYKPDGAIIHKNLGEALAAKGKLDEAIAQYRQALQRTNDAGTHYSLGLTLAVQSKWEEAIQHFTETVRLSPANAEAQYNLGYAFRSQHRLDEAAVHLSEAVRLKPEFALAQFNLGCVLADLNQNVAAIVHLREALRSNPNYKEAQQKLHAMEARTTD